MTVPRFALYLLFLLILAGTVHERRSTLVEARSRVAQSRVALPVAGSATSVQSAHGVQEKARLVQGTILRDEMTRRQIRESKASPLRTRSDAKLRLEVIKSRYCLEVWSGRKHLKTYPVALGGSPRGAKEREGDQRTPEGTFLLIPHHPSPGFGRCFYVCYPGRLDARRGLTAGLIDRAMARRIQQALARGQLPPYKTPLGGLILIHGTRDRSRAGLTRSNWTAGCIAMENDDLIELLATFQPSDRPMVIIRP